MARRKIVAGLPASFPAAMFVVLLGAGIPKAIRIEMQETADTAGSSAMQPKR